MSERTVHNRHTVASRVAKCAAKTRVAVRSTRSAGVPRPLPLGPWAASRLWRQN